MSKMRHQICRKTVVTVSYNSSEVLPAMIRSFPTGVPLIVVDNASPDSSAHLARETGARVIALDDNRGFGAACNAGAFAADTEFVLFLNPDAALAENCIESLEFAADRYPDASAFNPRISDGTGRPYFKRRSVLIARREWLQGGWPPQDCEVPVLSGAALFCRKAAFDKVGGFDEKIFLYHEDDDLSLRLRRECGPLRFVHDAQVKHLEGRGSARSVRTAGLKSFYMGRSRVYAQTKHGMAHARPRSLALAIMKFFNPAILISARKRTQAVAFFRGVMSA